MGKELKNKKPLMHRVAPGVYRGHSPKNMTPVAQAALAKQDAAAVKDTRAAAENLKRNIGKVF